MNFYSWILAGALFSSLSVNANATVIYQYASSVQGFSSQWSGGSWSAAQALGAPDTFLYGDILTSWAPSSVHGTSEYITLGFDTPVYANGAVIRETDGNGFVTRVDLVDLSDNYHTVWTGTDTSAPGTPVDFQVSWGQTSYLADGIKIYVNTNHDLSAWEEIDSVLLKGDTTPSPEPAALVLLGTGFVGLSAIRRKRCFSGSSKG
jgi:hypothetical protein